MITVLNDKELAESLRTLLGAVSFFSFYFKPRVERLAESLNYLIESDYPLNKLAKYQLANSLKAVKDGTAISEYGNIKPEEEKCIIAAIKLIESSNEQDSVLKSTLKSVSANLSEACCYNFIEPHEIDIEKPQDLLKQIYTARKFINEALEKITNSTDKLVSYLSAGNRSNSHLYITVARQLTSTLDGIKSINAQLKRYSFNPQILENVLTLEIPELAQLESFCNRTRKHNGTVFLNRDSGELTITKLGQLTGHLLDRTEVLQTLQTNSSESVKSTISTENIKNISAAEIYAAERGYSSVVKLSEKSRAQPVQKE